MTDGRIGQPLAEEALTQAPPARSSRLTESPAWVVESEERFTIPIYHRRGLVLVRGSGARVWDAEGRSYIDCVAGHGVALVGHCNPYVVEAVRRQCEDLITCPCSFYNATRAAFLEEMAEILPAGLRRFFLCNSGTEAVEAAIKFARASTGRTQVVAARRGFHGRTLGALSATWQPKYRKPFLPLVPDFSHVPFNDEEALRGAVTEATAAVILEPVQGEGGVHPAAPGYLSAAAEICHARGALLILDEVQTGFGRTGRMFAMEHYGVEPDILCLSKGIAGGVPMGLVAVGQRVQNISGPIHGSTFGGNPLACAAASAALKYIRDHSLVERAAKLGDRLLEELRRIASPVVREVRGLGLMVGIELQSQSAPYIQALQERGVLALSAGPQVIRLLPPLVITEKDLDRVVSSVKEVLK